MVTFTQQHMDAIFDLANNVEFQGWMIEETQSVGSKIDPNLSLASLKKETPHVYSGQTELEYNKEGIDLYVDGTVAISNREINSDGEYAEYSSLTLSQLRVLLITAERIASASAESERQWQNYANERDAMDKLTANLIKDAENESN